MIKDDEDEDLEPNPWGMGTISPISDDVIKNPKRMRFIGFYENKEKNNAISKKRRKGLPPRGSLG